MFNPEVVGSVLVGSIPAVGAMLLYQWKNHRENQKNINDFLAEARFFNREFPAHRHLNGKIIYPRGMTPSDIQ